MCNCRYNANGHEYDALSYRETRSPDNNPGNSRVMQCISQVSNEEIGLHAL